MLQATHAVLGKTWGTCTFIWLSSYDVWGLRKASADIAEMGSLSKLSLLRSALLCLTISLKWGSSYSVKTKAYISALYCMYAQPLPIGASGMGIDVTDVTLLPWIPLLRDFSCWKVCIINDCLYLCNNRIRHASHLNSEPGRVFCFYGNIKIIH